MKIKLSIILLLIFAKGDEGSLDRAFNLFRAGKYSQSIKEYELALKKYPEERPTIYFNIAQAYALLDSSSLALQSYYRAIKPKAPEVSSFASNNIGVMLVEQNKYQEALRAFKDALIYNEENEYARFNYELLLKLMQRNQQNPPQQEPPPPDDEMEDPPNDQNTPPSSPNRIRNRRPPNTEKAGAIRMDTIPISEAKILLEEMRKNEVKFLQQLRKIPAKPLSKKSERKDW